MQGACFTISSLGGIGGTGFTPIVNTPEVGILGVSKAVTRPVWDGADASQFMTMYTSYGAYVGGGVNWESGSGFEEWAFDGNRMKFSAIPEPSTLLPLLMLGGVAGLRRRRR